MAATVLAVLATSAAAQDGATKPPVPEAVAPTTDDLFDMVPATGRQLKIDRRTGRISLCEESDGQWACRLLADDRLAYEEEIERLEAENQQLRTRLAELEGNAGRPREGNDDRWITPEDEKRLDEFLTFSDRALRRFFGMVQDLKNDLDQPDTL
jgi:hypothetical protein